MSYFKSWKMMLWKCCTQYASKFGKLSSGQRTGKGQFLFQSQRKAMPKNANYHTLALISHASKVMLKVLQARLYQYMNCEPLMFKLVLEKAEEPEIKLPTSTGSWKKQESSRKDIYFWFIDCAKAFDSVDHNKLENSSKDGNTRPPNLPLEKSVCRPGSNS